MRVRSLPMRILFLAAACWACASQAFAQEQGSARQGPDVVRVNTSLVQTDVMVFDKQGVFVDGLKRDQFALKVDGKTRDISFFERVVAGSRNEEAQLASARGNSAGGNTGAVPLDRGRTVFFFIDDLHLSIGSMKQAKLLLERFINRDLGQNDEAAIVSSSGQIGFLQQLTDNKRVLQAAAERLVAKPYTNKDLESPPMSEYQAMIIEGQRNGDVFEFFVDEELKRNPGMSRSTAQDMVKSRSSQIVQQAVFVTTNMLASLKSLVSNSAALPGRKLIFLVSDGFLLNERNSDSIERVRQLTSAAAAAGVIIYSIDARGLTAGMTDASTEGTFDPSGRLTRSGGGEVGDSQNGLNALAADTGGRAFFNTNALSGAVTTALKETSAYYLLAWRPETDEQRNQKFRRVEVSINGRPELAIRFRRGLGEALPYESTSTKKGPGPANPKSPAEMMRDAIRATYPIGDLQVALSLNFLDVAQYGGTLTAAIKVSTSSLVFENQGGHATATMDLGGGVFDDQGKSISSFNKRLTIKPKSGDAIAHPPDEVFYNHFCLIKPGLYQVRVAAVDAKQVRVGSAVRWIEIPDLTSKALALSSLIVGESRAESEASPAATDPGTTPDAFRQVSLNIDHRFSSSSHLRFLTFVYNALGSSPGTPVPTPSPPAPANQGTNTLPASSTNPPGKGPDLAVQVQVFRDNEPVITTPLHKIQFEGVSDLARLPYAAEVTLDGLPPGRYVLLVTVIDRVAKASASQKFGFQVD
jgi:VWFA-related protein